MKALTVHESAFTVLMIFDCSPGESERFAQDLATFIEAKMRFHPGFLSSLIYVSEDARKVVELFQWARARDWEAYRASDDGHEAVRWLAGRTPSVQFLELIRAIGNPPPGNEG